MYRLTYTLLPVIIFLLLTGCTLQSKDDSTVSGMITYRERIALPDDANVQVQLQDASLQDVAADILSEQVYQTNGKQVPLPFEVGYEPDDIKSNHTYHIQVRITDASGKLLFITTTAHPVITNDAPTQDVEILVEKVN